MLLKFSCVFPYSLILLTALLQPCLGLIPDPTHPDIRSLTFLRTFAKKMENFVQAFMINATSAEDLQCISDVILTIRKYDEKEYWPYYMLDASSMLSPGLFHGNRLYIGSYEECLYFNAPEPHLETQYCLFTIAPKEPIDFKQYGLFIERPLNLHGGVCIPATCKSDFINRISRTFTTDENKIVGHYSFSIDEGNCRVRDQVIPLTNFNWIAIFTLVLLALTVLGSTLYDLFQRFVRENDKPHELGISFSIYTNGLKVQETEDNPSKWAVVTGIKAFAALTIVYIHVFLLFLDGNISDVLYGRALVYNNELLSAILVTTALNNVDTFLFLSGTVLVLQFSRDLETKGVYDPIKNIFKRYLRSIIPFAMLILVRMGLSEQLGEGPVYNMFNQHYKEKCRKTYLSTLLAYNNFAALPHEMCFVQSWYTALDIQIFIVSQIVLIAAILKPKLGPILAGLLTLTVTILEGFIAYNNDVGPTPFIDRYLNNFTYDFAYPHTRSSPWFLGMMFGFFLINWRKKPPKMSKLHKTIGWIFAKISLGLCIHLVIPFDFINYTQPTAALYLVLHRIFWTSAIAWSIFALTTQGTSGLNPLRAILKWGPFQFLGNISFEIFLWHVPVIEYVIATARETVHMSQIRIFFHATAVLFYTILLAVLTAMTLTMPLKKIIHYWINQLEDIFPLKLNCDKKSHFENNIRNNCPEINGSSRK